MLDWKRPLPVNGARAVVSVAGRYGVDVATVLAGTGVRPAELDDDSLVVPGEREVAMVRNAQRALPQVEHLGIEVGQANPITDVGPLGYAYLTAAHRRDTLIINQRFLAITWSMCDYIIEDDGNRCTATFLPGSLPADVVDFYLQRDIAAGVHLARENHLTDPVLTTWNQLPPVAAASRAAFVELFGEAPRFGAPTVTMSAPTSVMAAPLQWSAPGAHRQFIAAAEIELRQYESYSGVAGQVRRLVLAKLADGADLEGVAATMAMSPRTLRRQLADEDTSFRQILDTARRERAEELLQASDLSVAQIASRLGYENPSAFTTAFRRWHDTAPSQFRRDAEDLARA